jgi:hypothetical protein
MNATIQEERETQKCYRIIREGDITFSKKKKKTI